MCGIAGIIHRGSSSNIGGEMVSMLQSMKHRGPDSSGYAVYGSQVPGELVLRFKVAEQEDMGQGFQIHDEVKKRRTEVDSRIRSLGAEIVSAEEATEYAFRYGIKYSGDLRRLSDYIEDVEGAEIPSIGSALELVKDLGDANHVADQYRLRNFSGTHAIGHVRMATESDVDICSAHPFWAYPFSDVSVVHNGQLTNYWSKRRQLERKGLRFVSNCDSELIAVYVADQLDSGVSLRDAMRHSIEELDGVFTYLLATSDSLGMAKDTMAAKPMVLYEGKDCVALASEEAAIRSVFPQEIETFDPYDGDVRVWRN
jgi:methylamine---glutamate N-methyltransferase subunit A